MMSKFKREDRYIVIKRSDLKNVPAAYRIHLVAPMFSLLHHLPRRECLVIESDWPEYGPAWAAIEARATGSPLKAGQGEAVAEVSAETFSSDGTSDIITRNLPIGTALYTAPAAAADAVSVPRELLHRLCPKMDARHWHQWNASEAYQAACELRALLAQSQGVKP